jgi:hypothetical protein
VIRRTLANNGSEGGLSKLLIPNKLAKVRTDELGVDTAKRERQHTLYVLDEPTVRLHMADAEKLVKVLQRLVDAGNSVVVVEHNLDVMGRGRGKIGAHARRNDEIKYWLRSASAACKALARNGNCLISFIVRRR